MVTLVSAFVANVNSNKSLDKYIELGKHLLNANINKIIFIDENIVEQFVSYENSNTTIIPMKKSDYYLYEYKKELEKTFLLDTDNKGKDTLEYIFTMCHKTEFIRNAIQLKKYDGDQYVWVDFGIKHIFGCSDGDFKTKLEVLCNKNYDRVRIASIWNLDVRYCFNIYTNVIWYFAGGVFGGNANKLIEFADMMKDMCIEIIEREKTLMWEVNIWYLIYCKNRDLFDCYHSDHNNTILDNY